MTNAEYIQESAKLKALADDIVDGMNYASQFPPDECMEEYFQFLIAKGYDPVQVRMGDIQP